MSTLQVQNISVSINCPSSQVYDFAVQPHNLPHWASGLSGGTIQLYDGVWIAESPMGRIKIKFAPRNEFGVLDHTVTLPSGVEIYNPMRVIDNNNGSEVIFTLFRQPEMTDENFEDDAEWVKKDLEKLKTIMEKN